MLSRQLQDLRARAPADVDVLATTSARAVVLVTPHDGSERAIVMLESLQCASEDAPH